MINKKIQKKKGNLIIGRQAADEEMRNACSFYFFVENIYI